MFALEKIRQVLHECGAAIMEQEEEEEEEEEDEKDEEEKEEGIEGIELEEEVVVAAAPQAAHVHLLRGHTPAGPHGVVQRVHVRCARHLR